MEEGERPNILNVVARRNNLATFDSQQLATLPTFAYKTSNYKNVIHTISV